MAVSNRFWNIGFVGTPVCKVSKAILKVGIDQGQIFQTWKGIVEQ